jgi:hypothetical protein
MLARASWPRSAAGTAGTVPTVAGTDEQAAGTAAGVHPLEARALSSNARYRDIPELRRLEATGSPAHFVVHHIDDAAAAEHRDYCGVHTHPFDELNFLLGEPGQLRYEIVLGDETIVVESPTTVWIPAGTPHSANLLSGTGTFGAVYVGVPAGEIPPS